MQKTTDLNLAYKVLKDEFRRAEHLLQRRGIATSEASAQDHRATVDTTLLMEVLELREALSEARAANDRVRVDGLANEVRAKQAQSWTSIRAGFARVDEGDESELGAIVNALTQLRYYRRFLDEVADIEEAS